MAASVGQRPVSVIVVAVLCLVLGLFGLGGALMTCGYMAAGPLWMTQMTQLGNLPGLPPDYLQAQTEWLEAMRPFFAVQGGLGLATMPLAVLLTGGGAMVLAGSERGESWLRWAFPYGLVLEPIRAAVAVFQLFATWDEMNAFMAAATTPPPGTPTVQGLEEAMQVITMGSVGLGIVLAVGWALVKMALYAYGLRTFRRGSDRPAT